VLLCIMLAFLVVGNDVAAVVAFSSMSMMSSSTTSLSVRGAAAKPLDKKRVVVFGVGGYLGGCIYGFLQRAGSLYGTGISGVGGSPRGVVATAYGSLNLNSILSKNFVLAQADESFIKLTDMTSLPSIQSRVQGFDAAILATKVTLENRPVTMGSYEKTPNDKTMEFFMDRRRGDNERGCKDPQYALKMFETSVQACREGGVQHLVVVETDLQFDDDGSTQSIPVGDKYIRILEESQVGFTYIRPSGTFQNSPDYTYAKGVRSSLIVSKLTNIDDLVDTNPGTSNIYREDLAALCVQTLLTLPWDECRVLNVSSGTELPTPDDKAITPQREWCVNSNVVRGSLVGV
jgi:uncharacterized protein YqkB